jgi:SAM-dependent methyltransferase
LFAGATFHGGVSTESLPFPDADFGAISGQYIVEYTNREATLAEMARVLVPGGKVQLILHHADSLVVQNAHESLRHALLVEQDQQLLDKAGRYFELAATPGPQAEAARQALIDTGKRLEAAAEQSANPILLDFALRSVTALLEHRARLSAGEVATHIERLRYELELWRRRLEDLVGAAMTGDDMRAFEAAAGKAGFKDSDYAELYQAGEVLVGWLFSAAKG